MRYIFLEAAREELEEAAARYEAESTRSRERFVREIDSAIQRILDFPLACPTIAKGYRWCRVRRFSYGLVYRVDDEQIAVVALMHSRRRPGYWKRRS